MDFQGKIIIKKMEYWRNFNKRKISYPTKSVTEDENSQRNGSDMGDINFTDLCDFRSIERSQILDQFSGDNSLIENQTDLLTFLFNYTLRLYIILSHIGPGPKIGWCKN